MNSYDQAQVEALFQQLVELPPDKRGAFLEANCDNPRLRAEVEQLLNYDDQEGGGLTPVPDGAHDATAPHGRKIAHSGESTPAAKLPVGHEHGQFVPGEVLVDRYRVVSILGKGGMGEVYRADDLILKEPVALKIMPQGFAVSPAVLDALRNEVRQARQVSHRHVCRVHDIGKLAGRPYLSMEFIEGEDLASLLRRIGKLPAAKAIQLAKQLAEGMHAAHAEDVLHLDLKPANLMIDRKGDIKISDFGLARLSSTANEVDQIAGTPGYMAPEQALGQTLTPSADIYAFGLILYEMMTGHKAIGVWRFEEVRAFHAAQTEIVPPSTYDGDIPAAFEALIQACLDREIARRPSSFVAIHARLVGMADQQVPAIDNADQHSRDSSIEESDVYLSFAPVDDQPPSSSKSGWITQFQRNLEIRVEQLSGKQTRVFRAPRVRPEDQLDRQLLSELPTVKAMISVLSPPFVNSSGCLREVETFWDSNIRNGSLYVDGHTRILKVVKTPVQDDDIPPALGEKLQELLGFDFYEYDAQTGRLREYAEWFGPEAEQRFHEKIYDLAQEVHALLKSMQNMEANQHSGKTVYLASTTSDIAPLRDRIRRELIGRGHRVLPDRALPLVAIDAVNAIQTCLTECDLAIHAFGRNYGVVPEQSDRSLAVIQNELSVEYSKQTGLPRIIWIPSDVTPHDERQQQLLEDLRTNSDAHHNAEIVVNTFQALKPIVMDKLSPALTVEQSETESKAGQRVNRIYLICDSNDEEAIEPLEDFLFSQGYDLILPDFEAAEAEAAAAHRENLQDCDGVIIFYGAARNAWVDVKLRSIQKMHGYGRQREYAFNAIYVAPPFDRRKQRYRTHSAEIIRQEGEFNPACLQPLLARLNTNSLNSSPSKQE